jgi:hypothetical protein
MQYNCSKYLSEVSNDFETVKEVPMSYASQMKGAEAPLSIR